MQIFSVEILCIYSPTAAELKNISIIKDEDDKRGNLWVCKDDEQYSRNTLKLWFPYSILW